MTHDTHRVTLSWKLRTIYCHNCGTAELWPHTWESNIHKDPTFQVTWGPTGIIRINYD